MGGGVNGVVGDEEEEEEGGKEEEEGGVEDGKQVGTDGVGM